MITILALAAFCLLSAALYALSRQGNALQARRAALRLLILGAAGLSLWPGCLIRTSGSQTTGEAGEPGGGDDGTAHPALSRWARLGRVWRELTAHYKGERGDYQAGKAAFDKLKTEMSEALNALPAWAELRAVVDERWAHIDRSRYSMVTCYKMMPGGIPAARHKVEEQVEMLQQLVDEGKLTEDAALKASGVLAVQAEYMARNQEAEDKANDEAGWEEVRKLWEEYNNGKIEAGSQAELAGKRLTEMTVDKMGWLAGPPGSADDPPVATCYDMAIALPKERE
jgi:hypothetical protein